MLESQETEWICLVSVKQTGSFPDHQFAEGEVIWGILPYHWDHEERYKPDWTGIDLEAYEPWRNAFIEHQWVILPMASQIPTRPCGACETPIYKPEDHYLCLKCRT